VSQQKLDLFELAACGAAQPRARASVMPRAGIIAVGLNRVAVFVGHDLLFVPAAASS
jgi:hypothetical protein